MKYIMILLAALLLVSAAPEPMPRPAQTVLHISPAAQTSYSIHGVVSGTHRLGYSVPLGEYTAYGATLAEATINASALEAGIRAQATAQAVRP